MLRAVLPAVVGSVAAKYRNSERWTTGSMSAIAFDTLKFAKRLKEAGFTEQQAEALAAAEAEFIEQNLATKRDIADIKRDIKELEVTLRNDLKQLEVTLRNEIKQLDVKIEQVRSDVARDLKDLEYRMTIKLGTMMVVAVAAMATLVKLL
ncbi:MAG: coiled-coil domain-containing protein [Gammaproteobacteria bacterium]